MYTNDDIEKFLKKTIEQQNSNSSNGKIEKK